MEKEVKVKSEIIFLNTLYGNIWTSEQISIFTNELNEKYDYDYLKKRVNFLIATKCELPSNIIPLFE